MHSSHKSQIELHPALTGLFAVCPSHEAPYPMPVTERIGR